MVNLKNITFLLVCCFFILIELNLVSAANMTFNGTVYDINGNALNVSNVSITIKDETWTSVAQNYTSTNATGWFEVNITANSSYTYQLSIWHVNSTTNSVDWVSLPLPNLPYAEFSLLPGTHFFLKQAGTINITVVNGSNYPVPDNEFAVQIKDQKLGYPLSCGDATGNTDYVCYVPKNRNYSIMIYPASGSPQHFVPVSFNWNNFSATADYNISNGNVTRYNATNATLHKQFNVTESFARVYGYINGTNVSIGNWSEFTVIAFLLEPGNMIFMENGKIPFNVSAWSQLYDTDEFNASTGTPGFYNMTLPYSSQETVKYLLLAVAKNGTSFYGSYRNLTMSGNEQMNFTMLPLLGNNDSFINLSTSTGGFRQVNITQQTFNLVNSTTNVTLSQASAHIELTVDYSNLINCTEFIFMHDISQAGAANFSFPLLNVSNYGFKEMNVYLMNGAPKRVGNRTASQIANNNNISISSFRPGNVDGGALSGVKIALYTSNSTCDVPNPPVNCVKASSADLVDFNPISSVMGGGSISFRMGLISTGIIVHYVNVDMLASGPPDAMFEDNTTTDTSSGFDSAMRFGSNGPTIYDYVLISMPYTEGNTSFKGLNESGQVNISIPYLYDEDWNMIWNASSNGTDGSTLSGNYTHYNTYSSQWQTLMGNNTCVSTTTGTSAINASVPCHLDTTNNRIWLRIPHFSGTKPSVTGSATTVSSSSTTTTGSNGGGDEVPFWIMTYVVTEEQFNGTYKRALGAKQRIRLPLNGVEHYIGIINLTDTEAVINVSSIPQQKLMVVGDEWKVELTNDSYYDLSITLDDIVDNKANLTITSINEEIPEEEIVSSEEQGAGEGTEESTGVLDKVKGKWWVWVIIGIIVVAVLIFALGKKKHY